MSRPTIVELPASRRPTAAADSLPFVFVNMAMSADGKIATANRAVSSFGSQRDVAHLYELRATADAVMCGARTAALGDVQLGPGSTRYRRLRLRNGLAEYNLRVVVSGSGSLPAEAAVFQKHFAPILVLTTHRAGRQRIANLARVADQVVVCGRNRLEFRTALAWLRSEWGVRRLLCEGGGELNAALFAAGLVDELHLTICPLLLGGRAAPTIADGVGAMRLASALPLWLKSKRRVGDELFCVFAAKPAGTTARDG